MKKHCTVKKCNAYNPKKESHCNMYSGINGITPFITCNIYKRDNKIICLNCNKEMDKIVIIIVNKGYSNYNFCSRDCYLNFYDKKGKLNG